MDVEFDEIEQLGVAHLGEQRFGAIDDFAGKRRLFGEHRVDFLLDGSTTDEFMYQDIPFLSNTERSISRLVFNRGVPPAVEVDHLTGGGEVQSGTAGLEREDEERRPIVALKSLDKPLPLGDRGPAVEHEAGPPEHALEKLGERAGDLAKLRENKAFLLTFGKLFAERTPSAETCRSSLASSRRCRRVGRDGCRFA